MVAVGSHSHVQQSPPRKVSGLFALARTFAAHGATLNPIALIVIYALMLAFDLSVLAGTVYMIAREGWSAWWLLAAVLICAGSNPRRLILAAQGMSAGAT